MANFCGSCGAGLNPNAKFCSGCGLPISVSKPTCPTCGQDLPQQTANAAAPPDNYAGGQVTQVATQASPSAGMQAPSGNLGSPLPAYGKDFIAGEHCGNCGFDFQAGKCSNCGTEDLAPLT